MKILLWLYEERKVSDRSGSWYDHEINAKVANRFKATTADILQEWDSGFRVVALRSEARS